MKYHHTWLQHTHSTEPVNPLVYILSDSDSISMWLIGILKTSSLYNIINTRVGINTMHIEKEVHPQLPMHSCLTRYYDYLYGYVAQINHISRM